MEEETKLKREQNALISELNNNVIELKVSNTLLMDRIEENNKKLVEQVKSIITDERSFREKIVNETTWEVGKTTTNVKQDTAKAVETAIDNSKYQLQRFCDDGEKKIRNLMNLVDISMEKMKVYTTLQKIFYWITPIAVIIQTIITTYLLLR